MSDAGGRGRDDLQAAIDAVYTAFARYHPPQTLHAAPKHDALYGAGSNDLWHIERALTALGL